MRPFTHIIPTLLMLAASAAPVRHLTREVDYSRYSEEDGVPVWDLSQSSITECSLVSFRTYGDSIYSETIEGWRRWFRTTPDSVFLEHEESLSEVQSYAHPIPTAATGLREMASERDYSTHGSNSSSVAIAQEGTYRSHAPVSGRLVTSTGDTLAAVMTTEEIRYDRVMRAPRDGEGDTEPDPATTERHSVTIQRWFCSGPLPVALSYRHDVTDPDGNGGWSVDNTYTADFGDEETQPGRDDPAEGVSPEMAAPILREMTVIASGGMLCLSVSTPLPLRIAIDIVSDSGIPYLHAERDVEGTETVVLPCGSLPPGRHLVAVSCAGCTETRAFSLR